MAASVQRQDESRPWLSRSGYVAFGLVVFAALYLVIFRLPDPRLTLDYVKALTWPALVAVVIYWLREPIAVKASQLLKIGAFGGEALFENNQQLQEDVKGPAAAVLADKGNPESTALGTESDEGARPEEAHHDDHPTLTEQPNGKANEGEPEPTLSGSALGTPRQVYNELKAAERRAKQAQEKQAIEDIMRVSAWWGYDIAKLGFETRPTPVVEWTDDGRPLIQYAKGEPPGPRPRSGGIPDLKVMASRLEQEIRDLEAKVETPMTIKDYASTGDADGRRSGERARLHKLKSQLRTIDPDSPLSIE